LGAIDEGADAPSGNENSAEPSTLSNLKAGIEAPSIAPDREMPASDASEPKAPRIEKTEAEGGQIRVPETGAAKPEHLRDPKRGMLIVMGPSDSSQGHEDFSATKPAETGDKRRLTAMAAVIALAAVVGAISGALATVGVMSFAASKARSSTDEDALKASVARLDSDVATLKTNLDQGARAAGSQSSKTNDRLDKLETKQSESRAKLGQLSEAVEKLRTAPLVSAPVAAKEATGSITPPKAPTSVQAAAPAAPKTEVGRLPIVEGWRIVDAGNGGALIEGRAGVFEVYPGNPVPGLGRVDAIRRQDGRWVVVTSKGLVVAR
jgi:outer membrane murein-binding lipoprotein Lpp